MHPAQRTTLLHRESAELHCAGTCRYDAATASLDFLERRSNPEISLGPFSFGNRSWNVSVRSDGSLLRELIIGRWTEGIRFRPTRTAQRHSSPAEVSGLRHPELSSAISMAGLSRATNSFRSAQGVY